MSPTGSHSTAFTAAIGVFDGVHLGHQQVLRQAAAAARLHGGRAVAVTFDRHPNCVVAPDRAPKLLYSTAQKLRAIAAMGIHETRILEFNTEFSRLTPEEFVRSLAANLGSITSLCVGSAFSFGAKRSGNVESLRSLGKTLGFSVHGLASVSLDHQAVSSTRIRELVASGDIDAASQMMGRPYALAGTVIEGRKIGRTIGFPTANLSLEGRLLPPNGVYAALAHVYRADESNSPSRSHLPAVVNIGSRPTFEGAAAALVVESHLLDFSEDLYGREVELVLGSRLRDEQRFDSVQSLQSQIQRDILATRQILSS